MKIEAKRELVLGTDMKAVKVTKAGPVTEVVQFRNVPKDTGMRKLNADQYINLNTGEVGDIKHIENRAGDLKSIRATLRTIRMIVNANVLEAQKATWLTLTYADNMTDTEKLYIDFKAFWLRFGRYCKKQGWNVPKYISVVEPQGRGAWHMHIFLLWDMKAPFIDNNSVMEKLWDHGWTKTKAVKDVDNIGAYFSAYLADIPLEEAEKLPADELHLMQQNERELKSFEDEHGFLKEKKFIKGGRLYLYPRGMCIIRHSRDILQPSVEWTNQEAWEERRIKEKSQLGALTFSSSISVSDDDGTLLNLITKEYYNANRTDDVKLNGKDYENGKQENLVE